MVGKLHTVKTKYQGNMSKILNKTYLAIIYKLDKTNHPINSKHKTYEKIHIVNKYLTWCGYESHTI